jgi:hypothetical protein
MEPIAAPRTIKVYQLIRQSGLSLSNAGASAQISLGFGFYTTLQEAEHNRTMELLRNTDTTVPLFHIFELDIPNPAYQNDI